MRIHHLNCGTHCPLGGAFFDGRSRGPFAHICTHVLLIETDAGLVLVDTGYGLADVRGKPRRLAYTWPAVLRPQLRESDTAARQIEALGFSVHDVRHIILTHLDFDHAGGIADFPSARIHLLAEELNTAENHRRTFVDRQRYRPTMWPGGHDWRGYAVDGGSWNGFGAVRELEGLPPEILLVPLRGHTLGHAGVAVQGEAGWLLHAGDAFMHHDQLLGEKPTMPPGLWVYERIMMSDSSAGQRNLQRLRDLNRAASDISIFCSHDTHVLEAMRAQNP